MARSWRVEVKKGGKRLSHFEDNNGPCSQIYGYNCPRKIPVLVRHNPTKVALWDIIIYGVPSSTMRYGIVLICYCAIHTIRYGAGVVWHNIMVPCTIPYHTVAHQSIGIRTLQDITSMLLIFYPLTFLCRIDHHNISYQSMKGGYHINDTISFRASW